MNQNQQEGVARTLIMTIAGKVLGIAPQTGEVLWVHQLSAGQRACLLVTETRIFACCPPHLVCLAYPSGSLLWSAQVPSNGSATLLLDGGALYVSTRAGELDCFSVDGQHHYSNKLKGMGIGDVALGFPGNVTQAEG